MSDMEDLLIAAYKEHRLDDLKRKSWCGLTIDEWIELNLHQSMPFGKALKAAWIEANE